MKKFVLAWAATAVAATGASVAVLGLLGTGLTGTSAHVLSQEEVRAALTTVTPRTAATQAGTPTWTQQGKLIRSAGGTVIAACVGDQVTLRSWSPAQGYSVDGVEPGPGRTATVEFEPGEGEDVELTITCEGGQPVARGQ
ncbi:septum formation initiator [Nonomuraea basaltis]|uniref:septum formation initiator n=1 Tax=Nonomuraea basaltis TaxID=2495887 RepID=UPI00110C5A3C|nr:septum formation initiator [Nonomuraea basaltis]TMS00097.1 septum formation initiator [Nonomuraea basaltis]